MPEFVAIKRRGIPREIPSTSLRAGTSLRLKNGYAQDDASERIRRIVQKGFTRAESMAASARECLRTISNPTSTALISMTTLI